MLATQAAAAIETSRLHDQLQSLARLEERERIAMDLHDGVIQSVYATALHLEDAAETLADSPAQAKSVIEKSIDSLHQVIKDIP
jgi:signal transduction histidine kinase